MRSVIVTFGAVLLGLLLPMQSAVGNPYKSPALKIVARPGSLSTRELQDFCLNVANLLIANRGPFGFGVFKTVDCSSQNQTSDAAWTLVVEKAQQVIKFKFLWDFSALGGGQHESTPLDLDEPAWCFDCLADPLYQQTLAMALLESLPYLATAQSALRCNYFEGKEDRFAKLLAKHRTAVSEVATYRLSWSQDFGLSSLKAVTVVHFKRICEIQSKLKGEMIVFRRSAKVQYQEILENLAQEIRRKNPKPEVIEFHNLIGFRLGYEFVKPTDAYFRPTTMYGMVAQFSLNASQLRLAYDRFVASPQDISIGKSVAIGFGRVAASYSYEWPFRLFNHPFDFQIAPRLGSWIIDSKLPKTDLEESDGIRIVEVNANGLLSLGFESGIESIAFKAPYRLWISRDASYSFTGFRKATIASSRFSLDLVYIVPDTVVGDFWQVSVLGFLMGEKVELQVKEPASDELQLVHNTGFIGAGMALTW